MPLPEEEDTPRIMPLILAAVALLLVVGVGGGLAAYFVYFHNAKPESVVTPAPVAPTPIPTPGGPAPKPPSLPDDLPIPVKVPDDLVVPRPGAKSVPDATPTKVDPPLAKVDPTPPKVDPTPPKVDPTPPKVFPKVAPVAPPTPPKELKGHDGPVTSLTFSFDGATVVSGSLDGTARVWSVGSGEPLKVLRHKAGPVHRVVWTVTGAVVTTSGDVTKSGDLTWWAPHAGTEHKRVSVPADSPAGGMGKGLAVSRDGLWLGWGTGDTFEMTSSNQLDAGTAFLSLKEKVGPIEHLAFSPNHAGLAFVTPSGCRTWLMDPGRTTNALADAPADVTGVCFDPLGNAVFASRRREVAFYEAATGKRVGAIATDAPVWAVAAARTGKHLAAAVGDGVRFYDPTTRAEVGRLTAPAGVSFVASAVALSQDGTKVAVGGGAGDADDPKNYAVYLWNVAAMAPPPPP